MTKYTYEIPVDIFTGKPSTSVVIRSDGAFIPMDLGNSDYQEYLAINEPSDKL
jgi:hypothetical protein